MWTDPVLKCSVLNISTYGVKSLKLINSKSIRFLNYLYMISYSIYKAAYNLGSYTVSQYFKHSTCKIKEGILSIIKTA